MSWTYRLKIITLGLLAIVLVAVIYFWYQELPKDYVTIYFLNVGQGDSILIKGFQGEEILIDGGKDQKVLTELSSVLPIYDRSLDVVMVTHPDLDHYGGLNYVLDTYQVGSFFDNGALKDSLAYEELKQKVVNQKVVHFTETVGLKINLGGGAQLNVLYPDIDTNKIKESNDGSMVAMLSVGKQKVLLTGDASIGVETKLVERYGESLQAQILKLGHHGSKTSSSELFLKTINPAIGIVSAGFNNRYGHPHKEVTDRLNKLRIPYKNTAYDGRLCFKIYLDHFMPCS